MGVGVSKFGIGIGAHPQHCRNMNVAVSVLFALAEYIACLRARLFFGPEHDVKLRLGGLVLKGPQFDSDWG